MTTTVDQLPASDEHVDRPAELRRKPSRSAEALNTILACSALLLAVSILSVIQGPWTRTPDAFAIAKPHAAASWQVKQSSRPFGALVSAPLVPSPLVTASRTDASTAATACKVPGQETSHALPGRWRASVVSAVSAAGSAAIAVARKLFCHRLPVRRAQSPMAEIAFLGVLYGSLRAGVRAWDTSLGSFQLRDELFQEIAVAHTYKNSVWPWIQTGGVALVASILIIVGAKAFINSMKEWENRQEMKEMSALGEDAYFLASTPVDATPLEKAKKKINKKKSPFALRAVGKIADWMFVLRLGACVGYLLPTLNVLDFGEISVSLYPYALGVPPSEPIVTFMQNTLKLKFLYNAYLKSGYYFLIVWFIFIQLFVRNKAAPFYVRFHSSQAILISMLLGVPQQVFFAVLNPWESGLMVQSFMYYSMVSLFLFILVLVIWCCTNAVLKRTMKLPLVSEAAVMWAGKE